MKDGKPQWRFAPTMGGAEQGANPGETIFKAGVLRAMVRETLQNSLDHHDNGLPPVHVIYQMIYLDPREILLDELAVHAASCLDEAGNNPEAHRRFSGVLENLKRTEIPCLAVIDENTTGLRGENWDNLIFREGNPGSPGKFTKGGSFGFGKNAPFNLSGCSAVVYSTRYQNRQGRMTRMAGRAQLHSHQGPNGERLQNIGFLAMHEDQNWNQPIMGLDIPTAFKLTESGTGVYILGFNQQEHPDWPDRIAQAAISQFFPAVQMENLRVSIINGGKPRRIDLQTLAEEIQKLPGQDRRTRHYHQAFREAEPRMTQQSGRLEGMGTLKIWISTGHDGPNRLAHVNRRGMLITDSRERKDNPLYPRGGTNWSPWSAITMAGDERTDAFLRRMEPPAHDAIRPGQLPGENQQENARDELENHRGQIRTILRNFLDESNRNDSRNIEELAKLFPVTGNTPGSDLKFHQRKLQEDPLESIGPGDPDGEPPGMNGRKTPGNDQNGRGTDRTGRGRKTRINHPRASRSDSSAYCESAQRTS